MKVFAVIMAGGVGSRFWPKSREAMPKQFQNIFDGKSLYQRTFDRVAHLILPENIFIVTNRAQQTLACGTASRNSEEEYYRGAFRAEYGSVHSRRGVRDFFDNG